MKTYIKLDKLPLPNSRVAFEFKGTIICPFKGDDNVDFYKRTVSEGTNKYTKLSSLKPEHYTDYDNGEKNIFILVSLSEGIYDFRINAEEKITLNYYECTTDILDEVLLEQDELEDYADAIKYLIEHDKTRLTQNDSVELDNPFSTKEVKYEKIRILLNGLNTTADKYFPLDKESLGVEIQIPNITSDTENLKIKTTEKPFRLCYDNVLSTDYHYLYLIVDKSKIDGLKEAAGESNIMLCSELDDKYDKLNPVFSLCGTVNVTVSEEYSESIEDNFVIYQIPAGEDDAFKIFIKTAKDYLEENCGFDEDTEIPANLSDDEYVTIGNFTEQNNLQKQGASNLHIYKSEDDNIVSDDGGLTFSIIEASEEN